MKRFAAILFAVTLVGATAVAQNAPATGAATPAQTQATPAPAGQQTAKPPQAKSKEEYAAFNTAFALNDPAALEKASDDFASKYADSELRGVLYRKAMTLYQQANSADKTVEMGRKALAIDPNEPVTLVTVSSTLADRTRETDLDRDERLDDAAKMAQHGIDSIPSMAMPAGVSPEQMKNAQDELRSIALGTLAMVAYTKKDYATAEKQFKLAIDAFKAQPDPAQYLRLTLSLDKQNKYPEALEWANKTLQVSPAGSPFQQFAQQEKDRLSKLAPGAKTAPAPASAPATTPK